MSDNFLKDDGDQKIDWMDIPFKENDTRLMKIALGMAIVKFDNNMQNAKTEELHILNKLIYDLNTLYKKIEVYENCKIICQKELENVLFKT